MASVTGSSGPLITATRDAGGRCADARSSASRSAKPVGSQRTRAWITASEGSPTTATTPSPVGGRAPPR